MSQEEKWCFQCQESGHIAYHCPNVWCFECNDYGHIVVDCPHRKPPQVHLHVNTDQNLKIDIRNRSTSCHHHENITDAVGLDHSPIITRYHSKSCQNSYKSHSRLHHRDTRQHHRSSSWHPHLSIYTHHSQHSTPHCRSSHIGAFQLTPETAADHTLNQSTNLLRKPHINLLHNAEDHKVQHTPKGNQELQ